MKRAKRTGKIYPSKTMFFRQNVGTAKSGKLAYEMTLNIGGSHPVIRSEQTGKWWTISWGELLEMAVAAGIDAPDSPPRPASGKQGG